MDNLPLNSFHKGTNYKAYEYLGAHFENRNGVRGVVFRVWAKKAVSVSVVGDFNLWKEDANPMQRISNGGVFETFIQGLKTFDIYKYAVKTAKGTFLKADPYAFLSEKPPETASKLYDLDGYSWKDKEYLEEKDKTDIYSSPVNIYEVNLASFKRHKGGGYYSYKELVKTLVPYVKQMGYTHVEFMPVSEYPFDGSWGYQVTGYYAVSSRFGTPKEFMELIDAFHQSGIGVIIDWVPAHFPKDIHGLFEFDGTPCYEYSDKYQREHLGWGTRVFDFGKNEVKSFLISNAAFLFEKFHVDGLRVDAVASMLYLNYDKKDGEWSPNISGGVYNLEAISFLRELNGEIKKRFKNAIMIAEESTAFPLVTAPVGSGGLGFNFKWNMGFMHDSLSYMKEDPYFRKGVHNKMTFSMCYAFSENYILPISHDEVVHGKKTLLDKMAGEYKDKFANLRAYLGYMFSHPGKKLMFMGQEYGQFKEWNYNEGLEFFMTKFEYHRKLKRYFRDINNFYKSTPSFYEIERSWEGFSWILPDNADDNVFAYKRFDLSGKEVLVLLNFSGLNYHRYYIKTAGEYKIVFNSDKKIYGGEGKIKKTKYLSKKRIKKDPSEYLCLTLPRLSVIYLEKTNV